MLDPIPFPAPPLLAALARKVGAYLQLETLSLHIHEILFAVIFYHTICVSVSPFISSRLFPRAYSKLSPRTRLNWDVHVVSFVQSTLISGLALWVIFCDEERKHMDWKERVWGYTGAAGLVQALATGYFVWDLWVSLMHMEIFGPGLLAHAASALYVFSLGFRPYVNYYAPVFILYELSSPFLNIHWFLDKLDMTGSDPQLYNGVLLMSSFFFSRLVWGVYQSYGVFSDVFKALDYQKTAAGQTWLTTHDKLARTAANTGSSMHAEIMKYARGKPVPQWYAFTYLGSNAVLTLLNVYWFGKMIETIRKRFDPPFGTRKPSEKKDEGTDVAVGRGLEADGTKTVEVGSTVVRRKKNGKEETPPPN